MKATQILQAGQVKTLDIPAPVPLENEVVIQVMASGICGTDVHIFRGEYLGDYPVIPGHEFSGTVSGVGKGVTRFHVGDRVAVEPNMSCQNCRSCLKNRENFCENWQAVGVTRPGGMAQYVTVPEPAVFDIGALTFEEAAFVEPLSCVLHGVGKTGINAGDSVLLLGGGPIGMLLLQVVKLSGASEITVVEKNPSRRESALTYGAQYILESLEELTPDNFDVVIDATGVIAVMEASIEFARPGGRVLLFGVPPADKQMSMEAFTLFRKGLTVLSSFTSLRNSYQAVDLLVAGRVDVRGLISHRLPLEDFAQGVEIIEQVKDNVMKVMILPNG
jgi:2-desacetyl-2-hydroxyethyl bacteriochlorophyllide A dehydrogenase